MAIGTITWGTHSGGPGSGDVTAPGMPAGMAEGDGMLYVIYSKFLSNNFTTPTDWEIVANCAGTAQCRAIVFGRRYTAGATIPNVVRSGTSNVFIARVARVPGIKQTGAIAEAVSGVASSAAVSVTALDFTSGLTTLTDGAAVFAIAVQGNDAAAPAGGGDTVTYSPMATHSGITFSELLDMGSSDGSDVAGCLDYGIKATAGVVGTTGTIASTISSYYSAMYFAIAPEPDAPVAVPRRRQQIVPIVRAANW